MKRESAAELAATANNVLVNTTLLLNNASPRGEKDQQAAIRQGIVQVIMLVAPFQRVAERVHLTTLTHA